MLLAPLPWSSQLQSVVTLHIRHSRGKPIRRQKHFAKELVNQGKLFSLKDFLYCSTAITNHRQHLDSPSLSLTKKHQSMNKKWLTTGLVHFDLVCLCTCFKYAIIASALPCYALSITKYFKGLVTEKHSMTQITQGQKLHIQKLVNSSRVVADLIQTEKCKPWRNWICELEWDRQKSSVNRWTSPLSSFVDAYLLFWQEYHSTYYWWKSNWPLFNAGIVL